MKNFVIYNSAGEIMRIGICSKKDFRLQVQKDKDEYILKGIADATTQKIVDGEIVDKTPAEIRTFNPTTLPTIPEGQRFAMVTNEQWQDILKRISALEKKL